MPMQFCNASRPSKSVESKRDRPTQKIGVVHQKIRRVICRDGCFHVLRPPENPKPQKTAHVGTYFTNKGQFFDWSARRSVATGCGNLHLFQPVLTCFYLSLSGVPVLLEQNISFNINHIWHCRDMQNKDFKIRRGHATVSEPLVHIGFGLVPTFCGNSLWQLRPKSRTRASK